jgi:hypothetical protein
MDSLSFYVNCISSFLSFTLVAWAIIFAAVWPAAASGQHSSNMPPHYKWYEAAIELQYTVTSLVTIDLQVPGKENSGWSLQLEPSNSKLSWPTSTQYITVVWWWLWLIFD